MAKDWVQWRLDTALDKEPETISFIDEMPEGSVLYDIGANIGTYTTYAADKGIVVVAFEPHIPTARILAERTQGYKNVAIIPVALGEATRIAPMYYKSNLAGTSGHQIDAPVDEHGEKYKPAYTVNGLSFALDDLKWLPKPNFIKIDVDGREMGVLWGGKKTVEQCKGILIETNEHSRDCVDLLLSWGFVLHDRLNNIPGHSRERRAKEPGNTAENHILVRA